MLEGIFTNRDKQGRQIDRDEGFTMSEGTCTNRGERGR